MLYCWGMSDVKFPASIVLAGREVDIELEYTLGVGLDRATVKATGEEIDAELFSKDVLEQINEQAIAVAIGSLQAIATKVVS